MKSLSIILPFPDHGLTKNRGNAFGNRGAMLGMIKRAHHAVDDAMGFVSWTNLNGFAETVDLLCVVECERKPRGQRWDAAGMIEACKPYIDRLQGWAYSNDRQVTGYLVLWDEKPTGTGVIHMTFMPVEEAISAAVRETIQPHRTESQSGFSATGGTIRPDRKNRPRAERIVQRGRAAVVGGSVGGAGGA